MCSRRIFFTCLSYYRYNNYSSIISLKVGANNVKVPLTNFPWLWSRTKELIIYIYIIISNTAHTYNNKHTTSPQIVSAIAVITNGCTTEQSYQVVYRYRYRNRTVPVAQQQQDNQWINPPIVRKKRKEKRETPHACTYWFIAIHTNVLTWWMIGRVIRAVITATPSFKGFTSLMLFI